MQTLYIHPTNPQSRLIEQVQHSLQNDEVVMLPSKFGYVFAIKLTAKHSLETIQRICPPEGSCWALVCRDLSQLSDYATMDNEQFQVLKAQISTNSIFMLPATKNAPKKLSHPKHKTIGTHLSDHPIHLALLEVLNEAFAICALDEPINEPYVAEEQFGHHIDTFVDVGTLEANPPIITDLT